jgi:hypothetical protein
MWQVKSVIHKFAMRSVLLVAATTWTFGPMARAQVTISVNPPVCSYGYYDYAPYGCAPSGFYGPGYFYNGIFLGVGPWASWGYHHGWGEHRFSGGGGGRYVGTRGNEGGRSHAENRGHHADVVRTNHTSASHGGAAASRSHSAAVQGRTARGTSHPAATRGGAPHGSSHATTAHGSTAHGSATHGGSEHH